MMSAILKSPWRRKALGQTQNSGKWKNALHFWKPIYVPWVYSMAFTKMEGTTVNIKDKVAYSALANIQDSMVVMTELRYWYTID